MPQKRRASAVASAKIASDAQSTRRRKSDSKKPSSQQQEQQQHDDNDQQDSLNENNKNEEKEKLKVDKDSDEQQEDDVDYPPDKRRKTEEENGKEGEQKSDQALEEKVEEFQKKMSPNILEKGHIYFLYRPKVDVEKPDSADEVQRTFMVLLPYFVRRSLDEEPVESFSHLLAEGKLEETKFDPEKPPIGKARVIAIARKKLPEISKHSKLWSFVDIAFDKFDDIKEFVAGKTYQTATRGNRTLQECRLMGRGVYSIVEHHGHTHLAYVLEFPEEPSQVQKDFNIGHEGSYIISVKNPESTSPPHAGLSEHEKVKYPTRLLEKFQGRRFIALPSTEFLDYNGAELLLIGAREDLKSELGESGEELEELAEYEIKNIAPIAERSILDELHVEKGVLPTEPLRGLWK